ncbi:MAG: malto-oligosyltrehalose synthase, partial [Thermomicrobiales bacterium]
MNELTSGISLLQPSGVRECLERLAASGGGPRPLAVYRMQFHAGWRFDDARSLVSYLHDLGISHLYSSPILKARAGSQHGYDIIDHNAINPELGSEQDFRSLASDLKSSGLGILLDTVPNHMGVGYGTNPWWQDVLENGRSADHADYFDIDWESLKPELQNKVLLPVLGGQYGEELEQGRIQIRWEGGGFRVNYYDKNFALDPRSYPLLFEDSTASLPAPDRIRLQEQLRALRNLPPHHSTDPDEVSKRRRDVPVLKEEFASLVERSSTVRELLNRSLTEVNGNPGDPSSFDRLHRVLEAQAYRLAHWRVSTQEINYRRFFDVNDLVGLCMENPEVFAATHRLIRRLLADGTVDGLRLDHPDGLFNPMQYLTRLQMLYAASHCHGPDPQGELAENGIERELQAAFSQARAAVRRPPLYVVVEKILEPGEQLPQDWATDGTVGYEFGVLLTNLFVDSRNRRAFTNLYERFIGGRLDPDTIIYESKHLILHNALASEVTVLTQLLARICAADRYARDFTIKMLADGIREVIACFPVYRTYVDARGSVSDRDRAHILEAVSRAKRRNESTAHAVFDLIRDILLLKQPRSPGLARERLRFTMKFQQLTGPTMAKGLEDTACYVYNRLASVNEVGGSPRDFGITVEEFHEGNRLRLEQWPHQLLNTSTHDSKRSEDVRARINVLSEMPKQWSAQVLRWRRANRARKRVISDGRNVPDANEEYLLYQTLVGAYPFRMETAQDRQQFIARMQQYMSKAVHEAKVNLSWTNPNPEYIAAMDDFIARILQPGKGKRPNGFLPEFQAFLQPVMFFGALNSLAQVLLKITAPGVPDIYQGNELFDFSLVDPDNRRPVDYGQRRAALASLLDREHNHNPRAFLQELLSEYQDGRVKLWTTAQSLRFRRGHRNLFLRGTYRPLTLTGEKSQHVLAFVREYQSEFALVAVPRFVFSLLKGDPGANLADAFGDTQLPFLASPATRLTNILTGERVDTEGRVLYARDLFRDFPVAL